MAHLVKAFVILTVMAAVPLAGCKYYGGAMPPENPISMDAAHDVARNRHHMVDAQGRPLPRPPRPEVSRPTYLPEAELAVVAAPKTLLVWNYPYVADDNTRTFGNWSTIFLNDRYEWVLPANEVPMSGGGGHGHNAQ